VSWPSARPMRRTCRMVPGSSPLSEEQATASNLARLSDSSPSLPPYNRFANTAGVRCVARDRLPLAGPVADEVRAWEQSLRLTGAHLSDLPRQTGLYGCYALASRGTDYSRPRWPNSLPRRSKASLATGTRPRRGGRSGPLPAASAAPETTLTQVGRAPTRRASSKSGQARRGRYSSSSCLRLAANSVASFCCSTGGACS